MLDLFAACFADYLATARERPTVAYHHPDADRNDARMIRPVPPDLPVRVAASHPGPGYARVPVRQVRKTARSTTAGVLALAACVSLAVAEAAGAQHLDDVVVTLIDGEAAVWVRATPS